jgi:hypothetical protein
MPCHFPRLTFSSTTLLTLWKVSNVISTCKKQFTHFGYTADVPIATQLGLLEEENAAQLDHQSFELGLFIEYMQARTGRIKFDVSSRGS